MAEVAEGDVPMGVVAVISTRPPSPTRSFWPPFAVILTRPKFPRNPGFAVIAI